MYNIRYNCAYFSLELIRKLPEVLLCCCCFLQYAHSQLRLRGGIKTPATVFMMRRIYNPLPVMRHKFPAKLVWHHHNTLLCVPVGVRIARLWSPISDKRDGCRGYYWISPEAKNEVAGVGGTALCKERGRGQCDVSSSQAVTTRELLPSNPPPNRGQRSVGHRRWAPLSGGVTGKEASQGTVGCLCVSAHVKIAFCQVPLRHLIPEPSSEICRSMIGKWGSRGTLSSVIPGQSQINRVSVSRAAWPLSHFKSGPFRLFDLTSISHVIDSPRDLFFSPHIWFSLHFLC